MITARLLVGALAVCIPTSVIGATSASLPSSLRGEWYRKDFNCGDPTGDFLSINSLEIKGYTGSFRVRSARYLHSNVWKLTGIRTDSPDGGLQSMHSQTVLVKLSHQGRELRITWSGTENSNKRVPNTEVYKSCKP